MSAAQEILNRQADKIVWDDIYCVNVTKYPFVETRYLERCIRKSIAQAILDNVSNSEHGLAVRDGVRSLDILDGEGKNLNSEVWSHIRTTNYQDVYSTGRNCDNDRKVYCVYGLSCFGGDVTSEVMRITDGAVRIRYVQSLSDIKYHKNIVFMNPVFLKTRSNSRFRFEGGELGKTEKIKILFFVVESIGQTILG